MKNILFNYKILLAGLFTILFSCQKMDYTEEKNWAYPLSGEWVLQIEYDGDVDPGPYFIKVYNTSSGQDSVWIDDHGTYPFWPFKAKAKADIGALTFSTTNYLSLPGTRYEDAVTITGGKVIATDSIYFEAEFGSYPGTIFKYYGHRAASYDETITPH